MIAQTHRTIVLALRCLSLAAPGLVLTSIGGDEAKGTEAAVRAACRRQWFLFGDDTNRFAHRDVRWQWWEDEAEIMRGEKLAPVPLEGEYQHV